MTKKHFEAFARYIREWEVETMDAEASRTQYAERTAMAAMVADVSARDNPRFDRARFMKACGLSE